MRLLLGSLLLISFFVSCGNKNKTPDVSGVKVDLSTRRFEKQFFAMDTTKIPAQINQLVAAYPAFGETFLSQVLGITPDLPADTATAYIKGFLSYYRSVYDKAETMFKDFSPYEAKIKKGLQFVKYYFPAYKIPEKIITFIGPADGVGEALGDREIYIGLQGHLGGDYELYKTPMVSEKYPEYITRNFTPEYIQVKAMQVIVDDMFPDRSEDKRLIMQMVERGKRLYLMNKLLPNEEEYKLIGYTKQQMKDCYGNEAAVWDFFIKNNYLQLSDNNLVSTYVSPGPKTQEMWETSPGNIGSFCGWQIVKKYMDKHPEITLAELMKTDSEKVYTESKYKP